MVDIEAALEFPTNNEKAWQTVLVGGVVMVLPGILLISSAMIIRSLGLGNNVAGLLVIAAVTMAYVPLLGYLVRVVRVSGDREATAPSFTPVGRLLAEGVKGFIVVAAYMVIPYGLLGVIVLRMVRSPRRLFAVAQNPPLQVRVLSWVFVVVLVLALYLLPAALTNFARHGSVRRAFAVSEVAKGAFSVMYFKAVALAFGIFAVGLVISQMLLIVVVGVFILFWVTVVAFYLSGRGFCEARGLGAVGGSTGEAAS